MNGHLYSGHNNKTINNISRRNWAAVYCPKGNDNNNRYRRIFRIWNHNKRRNKMSTNQNILTSPKGTIQWMAAATPYKDKKTGKESYSIKLAFDVKADAAFLKQVAEINDAKVVTAETYKGKKGTPAYEKNMSVLSQGKAFIEAKSNFKPEIYDKDGNVLEEAPMFFKESTGTAQMYVQPYQGEKGGTINLVGIKIHSIESPESTTGTSTGTGVDRETRLAQLRALAKES